MNEIILNDIQVNNLNICELSNILKKKDNEILYKNKISYHKIMSSLNYLKITNEAITYYMTIVEDEKNIGKIIINVFGFLQSLFVGIDSLYELSRGITKTKWSININQNKYLHQIKFIRNDVVGHPTNRIYSDNNIGFCRLNLKDISIKKIKYSTFTIIDNQENHIEREVDTTKLILNYYIESNNILNIIKNRLLFEKKSLKKIINVSLADSVHEMFFCVKNKINIDEILNEIKKLYMDMQGINEKKKDRFLWRISLIKILSTWNEDELFKKEMINYMLLGQITKLHSMSLIVDKENKNKFNKSKIPNIDRPFILEELYKLVNKDTKIKKNLLVNLHDSKHPLFKFSVDKLKSKFENNNSVILLNWLFECSKNNSSKSFLIGSEIKRLKKK